MIKLICFDLDGILTDTKEFHFLALNEALGEKYSITWNEHLTKYDGLKTTQKLLLLTKDKGLPELEYKDIWFQKQKNTLQFLNNIKDSLVIIECIEKLKKDGFKLACCSNSIKETVDIILERLKIINYFDIVLSNQDVKNSKPHPEIYWNAMSSLDCLPEETLIIEDSPTGLLAADRSCANVLRLSNPTEVTYNNIKLEIEKFMNKTNINSKWVDRKLNILVPMAGNGQRFKDKGYSFPKPLIDVNGKPMIQVVVENLNIDANYIYIVQKEHREKYNLDTLLNLITPNCKIVETNGVTEGAACSALLAKDHINNDNPLFFANSDQFVEWNSSEFLYKMQESNIEGGIVTFKNIHPKWSYAKINEFGLITEVAEKNPISDNATVGFYWWKYGSDFIKYAEQMISKNIRVNNEFYICPIFNEAIQDGKKIKAFEVQTMYGLGVPEDLEYFLKNYNE
jgi:HAD superfamily hydrolase (TIGR01509 family)